MKGVKTRDLIGIILAISIFIGAGLLLYTQLAPAQKNSGIMVEVPNAIQQPLASDDSKTDKKTITELEDFYKKVDIKECADGQTTGCVGGKDRPAL